MVELSRLGRYQLRQVLGRGAMGVVYEGLDPSLNRRVAVKTILKNAAIDPETAALYSAQFAREAQAAGRLNHPNIVQVHDFAEEGEIAYLVMEYIQGRELRSFFEAREKFDVAETVRIMCELLDALDFAHEAGVIHRDIKPANVMLDAQRRVKLADFGVARIQDSERSAAGTMVGTPAFMSPEQIQGMKIDRRTDIFSAGIILYQLLTGDQPFTGAGAWTVAKKIMEDNPPQPSSVVQSVSPAFDAIVNKALAKKAADRYASAREFAAVLRATVVPPQLSVPPATPAMATPKSRTATQTSDAELEFWRAIQNSTDAEEFQFYLEQFPEGTYAGLARHKMARLQHAALPDAETTVRLEAEAQEKRRQAEEKAAQEARRVAAEKTQREAEEKARQLALARLKQQEEAAARSKAAADAEATVAIPVLRRSPAPQTVAPVSETKKSFVVPVAIGAVVIGASIAAYLFIGRTHAPEVQVAPAKPAVAPASAMDAEKIRRETEERLRKEFAEKSVAERAALEKAMAEKLAEEKAAAERLAKSKSAADRAAAEKAAAAAAAAAQRAAAEKAAAERATIERANAERSAAERVAAERAAAEKATAEKAAAAKLAAEKAAAKAADERAAAEEARIEKEVAAMREAEAKITQRLEKFIAQQGRWKFFKTGRAIGPLPTGEVAYVTDGMCPSGQIKQVIGGDNRRNTPRTVQCIPLPE